ncbi:MAG: CapA family protein [Clostridia bacterium]|nr:CapA family protein [Clostridia bacterium]
MRPYKISIIGDVMSESVLLEGVRKPDGTYDYDPVFLPLKGLLDEADYRIANLETPVAGEELTYSQTIVSFNAPESLVTALQKIGIDAVSTANNHATDRGQTGLLNTLDTLDRLGVPHTGTYRKGEKDRIHYFTLGDTRIAMIAYTYGVNVWPTEDAETDEDQVNFIVPPTESRKVRSAPQFFFDTVRFIKETTGQDVSWPDRQRLKRVLQLSIPYPDDSHCEEKVLHMNDEKLRKDLAEARKNADLVLYVPHTGGQFNVLPGHASRVAIDTAAKMGFDAILAAHSHTSQMAAYLGDCPTFYSLGNVSMSSNTVYSAHETLPMFGVVAHLYVQDKAIVRAGYSLFKICEKEGDPGSMRVVPVDELYASLTDRDEKEGLITDVAAVVERISGATLTGPEAIRREYRL